MFARLKGDNQMVDGNKRVTSAFNDNFHRGVIDQCDGIIANESSRPCSRIL